MGFDRFEDQILPPTLQNGFAQDISEASGLIRPTRQPGPLSPEQLMDLDALGLRPKADALRKRKGQRPPVPAKRYCRLCKVEQPYRSKGETVRISHSLGNPEGRGGEAAGPAADASLDPVPRGGDRGPLGAERAADAGEGGGAETKQGGHGHARRQSCGAGWGPAGVGGGEGGLRIGVGSNFCKTANESDSFSTL